MKIVPLISLLLLGCLGLLLAAWVGLGASISIRSATPTPTATEEICSSNPYYAKAIIAMNHMGDNPVSPPYPAAQYSHAVLDSLYDQLYAEGKVGPIPPACQVTARQTVTVYTTPDAASAPLWTLSAGDSLDVYGRNDGTTWFSVLSPGGWGWVSADAVDLQPGAEVDLMPIMG